MDGVTYMRMKFYVKGSLRSGTVQLDMKKVSKIRYIQYTLENGVYCVV